MTIAKDKPPAVIVYPCHWPFKVLGREEARVRRAIIAVTGEEHLVVHRSNTSSGGKYLSLHFKIRVRDEEERNRIYLSLKNHPDIMIVI